MAAIELSVKHFKKPAHQVVGAVIKALEKNVLRQRWLMVLQCESKHDANQQMSSPEALHDFRVELRRLRVWLAQSRDCLRTRRTARRHLRQLAKASNAPRDQEVFLSLLAQITAIAPHAAEATRTLLPELKTPLPALMPRRRKQTSPAFKDWLAAHLTKTLYQCQQCFAGDEACLHEARIHIKHLRYLLEPLDSLPPVAAAITELKSLQTTLGDLHDLFRMRQLITPWLCATLTEQLDQERGTPTIKTRVIQQNFNAHRDQYLTVLKWQNQHYQAALQAWHTHSAQHRHTLDTHIHAVISFLATEICA